jgi:tetratricopeptide (TPR) repeat protein
MRQGLFLLSIALAQMALPLDTLGSPIDLGRADSLRQSGKMVQALTLYRRLATETLTGCDHARIEAGLGHIQWNAGNASEARSHLIAASGQCGTCPTAVRSPLVLDIAHHLLSSGWTADAINLLEQELEWGPHAPALDEVHLALAKMHFAEGQWQRTWEMASHIPGTEASGMALQAGAMLGKALEELPLDNFIRQAKPSQRRVVTDELNHLLTLLTLEGRYTEALVLSRKINTLTDPIADPAAWTLSQLNVAKSAELANKPLEALLAFHEAGLTAELLDDLGLRARVARTQARFEESRGATASALRQLSLADSLTLAVLNATKASKEAKTFETHAVLPQDPFELAAAEAMASSTSPGAWPFACALILLGLLAAGMRANELKRTLRRERVRSLRMQRMIQPEDSLNLDVSADLSVNAEGGVEEILTRPNRLDFEDIIASLEMDHGTHVEWELQGDSEGQSAPEGLLSLLSVTLKRLLVHTPKDASIQGVIRNDWHGIQVQLDGPDSPSTQELQRMFAGGEHSSTWNPVLVQIEKLAGRFTVEKKATGELALTFLLPHTEDQRSPAN